MAREVRKVDDEGHPTQDTAKSLRTAVWAAKMTLIDHIGAVYQTLIDRACGGSVTCECGAVMRWPGETKAAGELLKHFDSLVTIMAKADSTGLVPGDFAALAVRMSDQDLEDFVDMAKEWRSRGKLSEGHQ